LQREALALWRELHDKWGTAGVLENLGQLAAEQEDYGRAISLLEESLALSRELGDRGHICWVLGDLGIVALAAGGYARSIAATEEALRLSLELGDKSGRALALFVRGVALAYEGDHGGAASSFAEGLRVCLEIGDHPGCALGVDGLAFVAASLDDPVRAARLAGAAETLRGQTGYRVQPVERPLHERTLASLSAALEQSDLARALSEGRGMAFEQAIAYALGDLQF
jgi:tetratricopeptide (TPR) repeat protein